MKRLSVFSLPLLVVLLILIGVVAYPAQGQQSTDDTEGRPTSTSLKTPEVSNPTSGDTASRGVPLTIGDEEVFRIKVKLGPYGPDRRVESIQARLKELEEGGKFVPDSVTTREGSFSTDIVVGDVTIMTVTDPDAVSAGASSRQVLAAEYAALLKLALTKDIENHSIPKFLLRIGLSLATTLGLILSLSLLGKIFHWAYGTVESWRGKYIKSIKFQKAVLLSGDTFTDVLVGACRLLRLCFVLLLLGAYLTLVLSFFPETKGVSKELIGMVLTPLTQVVFPAILSYLPNVAFITIIVVITYYVVGFTRFLFREIGRGTISFPGFDPEWADPTYKITRFLLIAFALVLIFPYLPGSGSPAFQQVSLFLGILVSLGSSGAISHVVAGVFLTYTGAFKIGDRVKISDTVGDVVDKTLLATRIRTIKQEYITIPNGMVLGSHIINYSSSALDPGLILHTTITIGYDAPWKDIHRLLIDAAMSTNLILDEPKPFVLQTSLDDFYVSYQINAYTASPHLMAVVYSELHQNIQDKFNEAGVEIMSSHYSTLRDGNKTTIPENYLDKNYLTPPFFVAMQNQPLKASDSKKS